MTEATSKVLFKKGIWIKEQQGVLTMGSLDRLNKDVMVVSDDLKDTLHAFESDMVDALYGEGRQPFSPGILDMDILFDKLKKAFQNVQLDLSFENSDSKPFKCPFDPVYALIEHLVISSTSGGKSPNVQINATVVEGHLCIVYRDSESVSDPSNLTPEFYLAKSKVQGNVQFKKTRENRSYYDITIPSGE